MEQISEQHDIGTVTVDVARSGHRGPAGQRAGRLLALRPWSGGVWSVRRNVGYNNVYTVTYYSPHAAFAHMFFQIG